MSQLTVIVLTFNEENNIEDCLDSLQGIQANLFVVDSFSNDRTLEILKEREVTFVQHPFENYARQRNWAQQNVPFDTEWVLHLDAGERCTPELVNWINTKFDANSTTDGYMFSRRTFFLNQWIKWGGHYPNFHLRLYRKSKGRCEDKAYDQHFVVEGRKEQLPKGIDMIDVVTDTIYNFTVAHARWAEKEAEEQLSVQRDHGEVEAKVGGNAIERQRWLKSNLFERLPLFWRGFFYFIYRYFIRLGFLDGKAGLVFHFLQGFWFRFLIDSVIVEKQLMNHKGTKEHKV
ncbi:MAG: glycosyltransferase family 2 protein [Bacteroidota bacterium]